jgi:hypothetical protein
MADGIGTKGSGHLPSREASAGKGPNRVINLEKTGSARRAVYVPLKRRAARFLEALELTGNVTMARETAGLGKDRVYLHRKENAAFAAAWEAALARFAARVEAQDALPHEEALEKDGLVLRRGRGGRVQIVARKPGQWSSRIEEAFLAHLVGCGTVERAARAAGVSAKTVWERRLACHRFRERMDAAREEAAVRLEWMLIGEGAQMLGEDAPGKRDPQIAMWLLKRRDQEQAGTLKRGAGAARVWTFEESIALLEKRLRALKIPLTGEGGGAG